MELESDLQKAIDAATLFAREWSAWETNMQLGGIASLRDPNMKAAHAELIAKHCTKKERKFVDGSLHYSTPPKYLDVCLENVVAHEAISSEKISIDFKCPQQFYRFVMLKIDGEWKLDSIKFMVSELTGWRNGLIGS